ncbi:metallophosphoesterase [Candidatus Pacearchaeota archaeon]|nr:metallophosphoesterase [Candidatus Pacearchaeota archaeon]
MKIVLISDTHLLHDQMKHDIPDGDVLVHCGDGLNTGSADDFWKFKLWFNSLPHKNKIYVPGNHDEFFEKVLSTTRSEMPDVHILVDQEVVIERVKFYGSPWTPTFFDWYFMQDEEDLPKYWDNIPDDTDILLTHGPPRNFLDMNEEGEHCGSESLRKRVFEVSPKYHVFGHIHEMGSGSEEVDGIKFINASICTRRYKPVNPPIVLELN